MNSQVSIVDALWPSGGLSKRREAGRLLLLSLSGALLIALCSQLSIPFYPVPMTGQTFAVFLVGLTLGRAKGVFTVTLYLACGAIGLPFFANGGFGFATIFGPTGGYLLGFVPAAYLCGYWADKGWDSNPVKIPPALLLASLAIYLPGLTQLGLIIGWDRPVLELGMFPFLYGDALKALLLIALLPVSPQAPR